MRSMQVETDRIRAAGNLRTRVERFLHRAFLLQVNFCLVKNIAIARTVSLDNNTTQQSVFAFKTGTFIFKFLRPETGKKL